MIGSQEERALFNPALLCVLAFDVASEYERMSSEALPVFLPYLSMPICLHKRSREALPTRADAQMLGWIQHNPRIVASMHDHVVRLRPFVSAGLRLGLAHGVFYPVDGRLSPQKLRVRRPRLLLGREVDECRKVAKFLGRWFAAQPDQATALSFWGLRP